MLTANVSTKLIYCTINLSGVMSKCLYFQYNTGRLFILYYQVKNNVWWFKVIQHVTNVTAKVTLIHY